jgi:hypothetical protein
VSCHLYCSPLNPGAYALAMEADKALGLGLQLTQSVVDLPSSMRMLVYLNGLTWTRGEETDKFSKEIVQAATRKLLGNYYEKTDKFAK